MHRILVVLVLLGGPAMAQLCDQPFSPTRPTWEWLYRVVGERTSTYSIRKINITDGSFVQVRQTGSGRQESRYRCTVEGVFPVDFGGSGDNRAEVGGQPINYNLEVAKVTGVAIPDYERWSVGSSWKLVIEVRGTGQHGPVRFNISGTFKSTYRVVAQESIATPAGRFTAFRLQTTFVTKMRANAGPITIPLNFESQGTSWYAENVGLVKSIQKTRNGENVTELIALRK